MSNIYYLPSHEYIRVEGAEGYVGISEYDTPEEGDTFAAGEDFGAVESRKAASDLFMPVDAEVLEVNDELVDNPRLLNNAPLEAWILKVRIEDPSQLDGLMDQKAYDEFVAAQQH